MTERTAYGYAGLLGELLGATAEPQGEDAPGVTFSHKDLGSWATRDLPSERDWQGIPAQRIREADSVRLQGRFDDVRRLESLSADQPGFWVSLGTLGWKDERFPIDLTQYPVVEITYRRLTENAFPHVAWTYPNGFNVVRLPRTTSWRTVARLVSREGFPERLDAFFIRLYSNARTTEAMEVRSVRFRALTDVERSALEQNALEIDSATPPLHYPVLDEFLPLGAKMDAATGRRLAELLGVSFAEYWDLAIEDIILHHHNTIMLDNVSQLTRSEWMELVACAEKHRVKLVVQHDMGASDDAEDWRDAIETHIRPLAQSDTVLAWGLWPDAQEARLSDYLTMRAMVQEVDTRHPVAAMTRYPGALRDYAPHSAVAGVSYLASHAPLELGGMVRAHAPLLRGQQFWVEGPTVVYGTGSPEWNSCPELRLMVNLAFANGARGWLNNCYHNDPIWAGGTCERSLTGPFLAFSDLWSELDILMGRFMALAPMFLHSRPAGFSKKAFKAIAKPGENALLPEGVEATTTYRLQGSDYSLYILVSNDTRGMASVSVEIPRESLRGLEVYDLTDFVTTRTWAPMALERHVEMFPGQARIVLAGEPPVCAWWRDSISWRLIEDDRRRMAFAMDMARTHGLDTSEIESLIRSVGDRGDVMKLAAMDRAQDMAVNLLYDAKDITAVRTAIIDATAAICACDGGLCRLVGAGKADEAHVWGLKAIPLAREITHLRLELRAGRAHAAADQAQDVAVRAKKLMKEVRALVPNILRPGTPSARESY